MIRETRGHCPAAWIPFICLFVFFFFSARALGEGGPPLPEMPAHWQRVSDLQMPAEKVKEMSVKLGAHLTGVRNTIYSVNGKRVQLNVITLPDLRNAEKLMASLRSMKSDEALLQKGTIVYEFVGKNDVLPSIAEGRMHLSLK